MMRHVLVQIREDQQQLEHTIALLRIRIRRAFLEIPHDGERVG